MVGGPKVNQKVKLKGDPKVNPTTKVKERDLAFMAASQARTTTIPKVNPKVNLNPVARKARLKARVKVK